MCCLKLCHLEITSVNNTDNTNTIIENNINQQILNQHILNHNNVTSIINENTLIYKNDKSVDYTECSICLDDMIKDQDIRKLPCLHNFHLSCIDGWLIKSTQLNCPLCNTLIMDISI